MKVLIVQTAFIGDIVLTAPVIERLRVRHPEAELWLLTTRAGAELFAADPRLSGVIVFEKRRGERGFGGLWSKAKELRDHRFEVVYSLHRSARTSILLFLARIPRRIGFDSAKLGFLYSRRERRAGEHEVQRKLSLIGEQCALGTRGLLTLYPPPLEDCGAEVREWIAAAGPYVVLAPASAWATKQWSWRGFRAAGKDFARRGIRVAVVGAPNERERAELVCRGEQFENFAGRTKLAEMLHLVKNAALVVCNDSMVLHLASAFEVPVVSVFCATSPKFGFGPWHQNGRVVELSDLPCKPCRPHGGKECPTGTWACMEGLEAGPVLAAANEVIGRART